MSAEVLRRAAALMRERAEAATPWVWNVQYVSESAVANQHVIERWFVMGQFEGSRNPTGPAAMCEYEHDAEHIASWHPAVALAVADCIDAALCYFDPDEFSEAEREMHDSLLTLARTYLNESA